MNLLKPVIMVSAMALTATTACTSGNGGDTDKAQTLADKVNVVNGEFTPEILNSFGRVSDPQVSPDGSKVLYRVLFNDIENNKGNGDLWVMDIDGKNAKQITDTPNSESNAVWIDGGKKIAFVYKDDKNEEALPQMWVMEADGSSRTCVSELEKGIEGFVISPDEKRVILISTVQYGDRVTDVYPDMKHSDARIIDDMMYRHWNEWVEEIPQPFVADFDGSKVNNLKNILEGTQFESPMRPWGGIEQLVWTPDSKQVIYVCRKKTGKEYAVSTNSDLYLYDVEKGATLKDLTEGNMGYDNNPIVSKSGKLAWLSMEHDGYEADKNRIMLQETIGGARKDLTANWDYSVDNIAWSPDEKYIYFTCPFQGTIPMFRMEVATQKIDTIAGGQFDYEGIAFAGNDIITCRHSYLEPNEIYSIKTGAQPQKLTAVNEQLLGKLSPVTCQKVMVPTSDGKQMTTWVLLPPNFDKNKKYPAILFCEGGPQSPVSQFWSYRWNLRIMANHGYIVIAPNRRGLPGFGTEWNAQISGDYAGQNMKDYLAAVDYMKQQSYVDGDHIGCTGASYGGFSTYWLAGNHQGRFACFLAHAGIFDLRAQYAETEELWFTNWDLGGAPWEKDNAMAQNSFSKADPKNYVQNWDKPILVTTGENDFRISYTQTLQAFNAARLRGIPARMVLYPSECHWVQRPQNSIVWQREFFNWMDQWLKPESPAAKKAAARNDSIQKAKAQELPATKLPANPSTSK